MISNKRVGLIYHPTTMLFLDDNEKFLANLKLNLSGNYNVETYHDVDKALARVNQDSIYCKQAEIEINELTEDLMDDEYNQYNLFSIRNNAYYSRVFDPKRFSQISVIFVDYLMPSMNGVDFFRMLPEGDYIKVMLTGHADEHTAVNAFNEGVIDAFIVKDSNNMIQHIQDIACSKQLNYFHKSASKLFGNILLAKKSIYNGQAYIDMVLELIQKNNIVEYYALDFHGSMVMMDNHGVSSYLLVQPEESLDKFEVIATDGEAKESVLSNIKRRKHIPYLFSCVIHIDPFNLRSCIS